MHATSALTEADRLMTVCNSCRYCEGICAVFPAMEMRRAFSDGDLNYLANLCHNCGACYFDCQFSPPHEFDVNVPKVLSEVRNGSYAAYSWPPFLACTFRRNGLTISLIAALSVATFCVGIAAYHDPAVLLSAHTGPGAFYELMPHNAMAALFGSAFLYAVVAIAMGVRNFWRDISEPLGTLTQATSIWQAMKDVATLRYLDGGGGGCMTENDTPTDRRRIYHHLTFYGFLLCFAATIVATGYHYLLGLEAPYSWYDAPVLMGTIGGVGLTIGPFGLLREKFRRDPMLFDEGHYGLDIGFLAMLFLAGFSGLALLVLRATPAMALLLALHIGIVFAFFITLPHGKFVHGFYRFLALVRYAKERRAHKISE